MNIDVLTLFPQWFEWFRTQRHVTNALTLGHTFEAVDLRAATPLKWGQVDDTPFGGGAGMVLRVDVIEAALRARYEVDPVELRSSRRVIALTPGGRLLDDAFAAELAAEPALTLLCGRYEGFDERILEHFVSDEVSIGRYVLAGGELPAGDHVAPDRQRLGAEVLDDPLVEALVAAAQQRQHRLGRKVGDVRLVE